MLPGDIRRNAVPAITIPKPQDQLQQPPEAMEEAIKMVESDDQDGPERFASWYPLLQQVRRENLNQQHHNPALARLYPDEIEENEEPYRIPNDRDKVWVNKLVPYDEYPGVQLKNGILTPQLSKPPRNLKWLQKRLLQPRLDSDWTPAGWQKYKAYRHFRENRNLTRVAMRYLFKRFPERCRYQRAYYQRWYDFPEYPPFAQGLEQPCPGFIQGFTLDAYTNMDVEYLSAAVCYISDDHSLTLPHMAGEFAEGTLEAEEAADARHGAALVYMRNTTLLHARTRKDPEDAAVIITFISDGLFIRFYAHYESKSPDGKVVYHQYPILAANLGRSYDEFMRGVAMIRNCQDLAFVLAMETKNELERYHAINGINAWAYHPDDGEYILSESEDGVIEGVGGQKDGVKENQDQQEKQHISPGTKDLKSSPKETAHGNEDGDKKPSILHKKKKDEAQPPTTRVLRPRKQVAQEDKRPTPKPRKRKANEDAGKKPARRCLRPKS
ncbi:hypothetical protein MKX08_000486 [Trichoderma sp. CBMAI-0020]|nr:hypothetical protein MKX08_000486 [Trichoderma sp. CBMAI-0020]